MCVFIFGAIFFLAQFNIHGISKFDEYGRLIHASNKKILPCPLQTKSTAVILVAGQSNSANYADKQFTTKYPGRVFNYFNGICYIASSPLLGASGMRGEFLTPMADQLIDSGRYDNVVIMTSGIGNTSISRWGPKGDLGLMFGDVLKDIKKKYLITSVIWHQGERDYLDRMSQTDYQNYFSSFREILNTYMVRAPILIAISTRCGNPFSWRSENPIAQAQATLVDNQEIFLGVNSDGLLNDNDRALLNPCHFNKEGQLKVAKSYSDAIIRSISFGK